MNSCNDKLFYGCLWTYFEKRTDSAQQKVSFRSSNILSINLKWKIIRFINVLLIIALWIFLCLTIFLNNLQTLKNLFCWKQIHQQQNN